MSSKREQGFIRHVVLVVDESASISQLGLTDTVIKIVDKQVADLSRSVEKNDRAAAEQHEKNDNETRITVYTFNAPGLNLDRGHPDGNVRCQFYDRDVLRLPSLKGRYHPAGGTPLIDATLTAVRELKLVPEIHGQHRFLVYAITDGQENSSKASGRELAREINTLGDNWTVAAFAPDQMGVEYAIDNGFPAGNVHRWDATSKEGVEEVGNIMRRATDNWASSHTVGIRGTKSLFVGGQVNAADVKKKLTPLPHSDYMITRVKRTPESFEKVLLPANSKRKEPVKAWFVRIDDFVTRMHPPFIIGKGYYQLFSEGARKSERVQGNKLIAVKDKKTSRVYTGDEARQVVGLPDEDVSVKPDSNPDYEIFVQSTQDNRHLPEGTDLLLMLK